MKTKAILRDYHSLIITSLELNFYEVYDKDLKVKVLQHLKLFHPFLTFLWRV